MNILGTGSALPALSIDNDRLAEFLDTSDEWIASRTGIRSRHILTDETLLDLGAQAGARAIEDAQVPPSAIDFLICSTVQGDTVTPSLACLIQARLGLDCPAVDINAACVGFLYAMDMAEAYIASGKARHVLIVCSEGMSRMVDWTNRAMCVLFGDGAGAAVVGAGDALKAMRLTSAGQADIINGYPDGGNCPFTQVKHKASPIIMAGQDVYKFAVSNSAQDLQIVMDAAGLTPEGIDCFLLHQANRRIVEAVRTRMHQSTDKFPTNIESTGNTSSASVPILLDELRRAGKLKKGDVIAMSAFGAGLVTGALIIEWTKD